MRILIVDDSRFIREALGRVNLGLIGNLITLVRPFRWGGEGDTVVEDFENALDAIETNPRFDVLILDNDLGGGLEGIDFLKILCEKNPEKVPSTVLSCSSNSQRKADIEALFSNWEKNGRLPMTPTGVE